MKYTQEQFASRKLVWIALSDLFLDTDVTESYDYIVRECADSPYTVEELKFILTHEVAPAVSINLYSITGEWIGFDEEWLLQEIKKQIDINNNSLLYFIAKRIRNFGFNRYISGHWKELEPMITKKRTKSSRSDATLMKFSELPNQ